MHRRESEIEILDLRH